VTIDVSSGLSHATVEVMELGRQVRPSDPKLSVVKPVFDVDGHLLTTTERETGSTRSGPQAGRLATQQSTPVT
jgi:hypothetical protein